MEKTSKKQLKAMLKKTLAEAKVKHDYLTEYGTKINDETYKRIDKEEFELYALANQIAAQIKK